MKNAEGGGVIRLGDATSHGGTVISASDTFVVLGAGVAREGDKVFCPKCRGLYEIEVRTSDRTHEGRKVAYHGDGVSCGARLRSSIQSCLTVEDRE